MVRNILKAWPNVKILPETHFIVPLYNRFGTDEISVNDFLSIVDGIYSQNGNKFIKGILKDAGKKYIDYKRDLQAFVEKKKVSGGIKEFTEAFFNYLYGYNFIYGDKTPHYGIHANIIKKFWPEAKFIHIYRDGVDVAHSMIGHGGFVKLISSNISPKDIDEFMFGEKMGIKLKNKDIKIEQSLKYWQEAISETAESLNNYKLNIDYIEVKYEDLVFHPVNEITKIAKFLGIDGNKSSMNKAITVPRPFPEKRQVKKLSDKEYERYYKHIEHTMKKFGYPYRITIHRSFIESCKEFYRGRYNYLLKWKKQIGQTIIKLIVDNS